MRESLKHIQQEDKKISVIEELIYTEQDGTVSFGNYTSGQKAKKFDSEYQGGMYKVKTYNEITKLERNDVLVYEFVPGTAAEHLKVTDKGVESTVEGNKDAQITIQLESDTDYKIYINDTTADDMKANMSGKLSVSMELEEGLAASVKAIRRV